MRIIGLVSGILGEESNISPLLLHIARGTNINFLSIVSLYPLKFKSKKQSKVDLLIYRYQLKLAITDFKSIKHQKKIYNLSAN